ncbi:MAG: VWA domain-containing protein [Candidatus Acidiferrales bacterium]
MIGIFRLILATIIVSLLGAQGASAQEDACRRRVIAVGVSNTDNNIVTGMTPANFQATMDHRPVEILSVTPNSTPARVIIVLDGSGSMTHEPKIWQAYLSVAQALVNQLPPSTPMGFMLFTDRVELMGQLPTKHAAILDQLEQLRSRHKGAPTALYDTIQAAALQFNPPIPGDSIYALSDGEVDASRATLATVENLLIERGIRLFAFSITGTEAPLSRMRWDKKPSRDLVDSTGGYSVLIPARQAESLPARMGATTAPDTDLVQLRKQIKLISNFERVELELPEELRKPTNLELKPAAITGPPLNLTFPGKLAACVAK